MTWIDRILGNVVIPDTVSHGDQQPADGIHGIVSELGPYATAPLRRAAPLTSLHVNKVARQSDTTPNTLWYVDSVSSGVGTWRQLVTAADAGTDPLSIITSVPVRVWLRADRGVTIATGVSSWVSQDANAYNFVQATGSQQPTRTAVDATLNNQATITAVAGSTQFLLASSPIAASYWRVTVAKYAVFAVNDRLQDIGGQAYILGQGAPNIILDQLGLVTPNNGGFGGTGVWKRIADKQNNTIADSIQVGSVLATGTALGRTSAGGSLTIFSGAGGAFAVSASIAEIIITDGIPTTTERTNIDTYLSTRYGASLLT